MTRRCCDWCGTEYEAARATSRFHNATCRQRAARARRGGTREAVVPIAGTAPEDRVRRAVESVLASSGREGTPMAEVAVVLAARIDASVDTGSALASMARELRATLEAATASAAPRDEVDELRERREARLRSGAAG